MPAGQKAAIAGSSNAHITWAITAAGRVVGDRTAAKTQAEVYAAERVVWRKYLVLASTLAQDSPTLSTNWLVL
jgi:hypothetical protein